ncbi:MAG TPA: L-glutamate gamma-semialdehyde dehydrogenase [Bryobacterales bacterium]|nr:L-glutamate gamma-semialdehyde dehydrogenase [Bryobacterales bacterium]
MLPEFRNEPLTDFSRPENRAAMEAALEKVRSQLGREYKLLIGGQRVAGESQFRSLNPSHPAQVVGVHAAASVEQARRAVEEAHAYFPCWSAWLGPREERAYLLLETARILRDRKHEFSAWMIYETGKTWPEADADTDEAIDFCEFYAREALRLSGPQPLTPIPGEKNELRYLPLGVGVVIPPWNFPLAITVGMTTAALVAGNTVVLKPSSDSPTIAAKFVEALLEAGCAPQAISFVTGSGSSIGDALVEHPLTRFVAFTGSKQVGLRINELAAKTPPGQRWIKRVVAEMGGKDAIVVDSDCDLEKAVDGVLASAFGYQGQKCSACSRAIVVDAVYDDFVARLAEKARRIATGPSEDPKNYMGPVINERALQSILDYIDVGRREGKLVTGGTRASGDGYFVEPTIVADIDRKARLFQEEIFGPVLAVTRARDFDDALDLANDSEYGLTGAVFTNDRKKLEKARERFFAGNLYFNRKCTGALVGGHPFGGFNLSGTDSKAGGSDYLLLFTQAKAISEKL